MEEPRKERGIYLGQYTGSHPARVIGYKGERHLLCFGASGSGKSTSLLVPNLATLRRSMIVIDPKGQLAAITARHREKMGKVIVLNPFGLFLDELPRLKSVGWNPLLQLDRESHDFPSDARTLAEAVVDRTGDGKSAFFETSMENLWTVFCMWERIQAGRSASLRNVREAFTRPDFKDVLQKMTESRDYAIRIAANHAYGRLTDKSSQSTSLQDVISTIIKNTAFLDDARIAVDMAKGSAIDFRAMHEEITTIYVILPVNQLLKQAKWLRMFVNLALAEFLKGAPPAPKLPRVLFMLDEFGNLGRLPEMLNALNIARDYRVQLWMCLQHIDQLQKKNYPDEWPAFLSGAGAITFFGAHDPETSQLLSDMVGQHEVEMTSRNLSGGNPVTGFLDHRKVQVSENTSTSVFKLLPPEDTRRLGAGRTINFIEPTPMPVQLYTPVYSKIIKEGTLDPNPYYHP